MQVLLVGRLVGERELDFGNIMLDMIDFVIKLIIVIVFKGEDNICDSFYFIENKLFEFYLEF